MKQFLIIRETLERSFSIEADTKEELQAQIQDVQRRYADSEIILSADGFTNDAEFILMDENYDFIGKLD